MRYARLRERNVDLTDLHTFLRVARRGSFTAAARELAVPTSTVSRRVTRLEAALGVGLVHRTARAVVLTRAGEHLRDRCGPGLREVEEAARSLAERDAEPAGLLRLTAPPDLGSTALVTDLLVAFQDRCPRVRLEIDLSDRLVDLVAEGWDVALRPRGPGSTASGEGLMSRSVATLRAGLYASPSYLAAHGLPDRPDGLAAHRWVSHRAWAQRGLVLTREPGGDRCPIDPEPRVLTNHLGQILALLVAGAGIGAAPEVTADRYVERGALVRVLPGWAILGGQITLVWPASRHTAPRVRAFLDVAVAFFGSGTELDLAHP